MSSNNFLFCLIFVFCYYSHGYTQPLIEKNNTKIADSLDILGEYEQALKYRDLALIESNHSPNYYKFLQAKWHYTQSCIYEATGGLSNHNKALEHSLKAREIYNANTNPSIWFKHQIANRIYHQYGYLQKWKTTLVEAQKDLQILQDSLPESDHKMLLILDDLGYINTRLGDFSRSLTYYDKTIQLYLKHHKDNKKDIAMNYAQMSENYRKLGMRKKEISALIEMEKLWKQIPENRNSALFGCYGNLSFWYTYYGNYELAETYLNKQSQIIDSIKHKDAEFKFQRRKKYLDLYKNYIELNFKRKDYNKVKKYIAQSKHELKASKRVFIEDVKHEASIHFYDSQLPEKTADESIALIKKAIDLTILYKDEFYLDPSEFKIALFKKYMELNRYDQAENVLFEIIADTSTNNEHRLFFLYTNYAHLLSKRNQYKQAESYFKKALNIYGLNINHGKNLTQISIKDLKPFYSFESIGGIILTANFYLERYVTTEKDSYLKTAQNLYFLSSDMFANLYLGDRYNENLFDTYKAIENGLIEVLKQLPSPRNIERTVEAIERNSSKLTWSKFKYSKEKPLLNIPDSIIEQEDDLKTLINYYQNELYTKKAEQQLETDSLRHRISTLNLELQKLQESIKSNYSKYYNRNFNAFDLTKFRETLSQDKLILKYVFSESQLYCFHISNSKLGFVQLKTSKQVKTDILNYIKKLSIFNPDYVEDAKHLKAIIEPLIKDTNVASITIIPDDVLSYLPFETLIGDTNTSTQGMLNYSFCYSSSLTLLNEQNSMTMTKDNLKVGVFSSENSSNTELPSVIDETKGILNHFDGQSFNEASKVSFLKEAKTFSVLHLAMHANIDNNNPEFSSLDFGNDKLLVSELYNETINADLAVLSACETGNGIILKGEGIQSISKAFTYSGIPSTVVSLWKVDDEATSILMTAFYKHLKAGESKDVALKNAKIDYLNSVTDPALKHPYYWAGFVLTGNTAPLVINKPNYLYVGLASASFVMLFLFRKKLQFFK